MRRVNLAVVPARVQEEERAEDRSGGWASEKGSHLRGGPRGTGAAGRVICHVSVAVMDVAGPAHISILKGLIHVRGIPLF